LAHAALFTHSDGKQTKAEEKILRDISEHLGFAPAAARTIIEHAKERADEAAGKG
jgi:tellurite resistance protein